MNQYPNGPQQPSYPPNGMQMPPAQGYPQPQYPQQTQFTPPGYPQTPPVQQSPRELIRVGCKQGKLIITDQHIRVELFSLSSHTMPRSSLTGIDYKLVVPALFGFGGGANLIFHGQGAERLHAELMRPKYAKQIMRMLGY